MVAVFILGNATSIYTKPVKLIEVPEYIGNYKTIDILEYFMKTKKVKVKELAPETVKKEQTAEVKKSEAKRKKIMADDAHM